MQKLLACHVILHCTNRIATIDFIKLKRQTGPKNEEIVCQPIASIFDRDSLKLSLNRRHLLNRWFYPILAGVLKPQRQKHLHLGRGQTSAFLFGPQTPIFDKSDADNGNWIKSGKQNLCRQWQIISAAYPQRNLFFGNFFSSFPLKKHDDQKSNQNDE